MNFTDLFSNEIIVRPQPRRVARSFHGFPGANGLTAITLGLRGRLITVTGILRATGETYAAARANLETGLANIESYMIYPPQQDYTFYNSTYYNVTFDKFNLAPFAGGKLFARSGSQVICQFTAMFTELV